MKKYYTIALALIGLVSVSCQKVSSDAENNENGKNIVKTVISASIAGSDDATKTSLDPGTLKLSWAENDRLYVMAADNADLWNLNEFNIVNSSINGGAAEFTSSVDMSAGTFFVAFYGKKAKWADYLGLYLSNKDREGTGLSYPEYKLDYSQPYCSNGPNPDFLLMRSTKESGNSLDHLVFENMTSIMKIQVKDTRASKGTLSSIKIKMLTDYVPNQLFPISGRFYGNWIKSDDLNEFKAYAKWDIKSNNVPTNASIESGGPFGNAVLLNNINVPLTAEAQSFYIVVWPGKHGKISVTLTDSESNSKTLYFDSFTSTKGKVSAFPVIDLGDL